MFWQQRPNPDNWIDQIRYFTDFNKKLTNDELRDAFINLAHLFVTEFSNEKLLEEIICNELGEEALDKMWNTEIGRELLYKDVNPEDHRDILGPTLNMCDYIEERWFK